MVQTVYNSFSDRKKHFQNLCSSPGSVLQVSGCLGGHWDTRGTLEERYSVNKHCLQVLLRPGGWEEVTVWEQKKPLTAKLTPPKQVNGADNWGLAIPRTSGGKSRQCMLTICVVSVYGSPKLFCIAQVVSALQPSTASRRLIPNNKPQALLIDACPAHWDNLSTSTWCLWTFEQTLSLF